MITHQPYLPRHMAGNPGNPLDAHAMYLNNTIYRIHGTNAPETIGTHISSNCLHLTNKKKQRQPKETQMPIVSGALVPWIQ